MLVFIYEVYCRSPSSFYPHRHPFASTCFPKKGVSHVIIQVPCYHPILNSPSGPSAYLFSCQQHPVLTMAALLLKSDSPHPPASFLKNILNYLVCKTSKGWNIHQIADFLRSEIMFSIPLEILCFLIRGHKQSSY